MSAEGASLGVDIGGTKTALIARGADGSLSEIARFATEREAGSGQHLSKTFAVAEQLLSSVGCDGPPDSVGYGMPGPLDGPRGHLLAPPGFESWGNPFDLQGALRERWPDALMQFDNDCTVGGWGEFVRGAGKGCASLCYFGVGTGIGGSVIVDGAIVHGASGNAGELGHIHVVEASEPCICGAYGCVESVASGTALGRQSQAAGFTIDELGPRMRAGDPAALKIVSDAGLALGKACAVVMNILSPERIVIGGGVAAHLPELVGIAGSSAASLAFRPNDAHTTIVAAQLEGTSVLYGALAIAESAVRAMAPDASLQRESSNPR